MCRGRPEERQCGEKIANKGAADQQRNQKKATMNVKEKEYALMVKK